MEPEPRRLLNGISEVRTFFHTNAVPLYFISPTPFNLLGIDRWVLNFFYLTYFDSFEGAHPRVFVPRRRDRRDFGCIEDVCNHLLYDPETFEFIAHRGPDGKACFVMLDEETQALAHKAGLEVMHPSAALRHRLGSKIVMTRLAEEAGVPSVPNVIGRVGSYDELLALAQGAGLGDDLAAYGDSGTETFFLRGQRDWDHWAGDLVEQEVKVMKRIPLIDESEAFYMRVAAPGDLRCKGAQLGVLVTRGHLQTKDYQLTERARRWVEGIKAEFASTPLVPGEAATPIVSRLVARA